MRRIVGVLLCIVLLVSMANLAWGGNRTVPGHPDWQPPLASAGGTSLSVLANPGAGVSPLWTVPANHLWRPVLVKCVWANASGGAGAPSLQIKRGASVLALVLPIGTIANLATGDFTWARGITTTAIAFGNAAMVALPDVTLIAGDVIQLINVGASTFTSLVLTYEDYAA